MHDTQSTTPPPMTGGTCVCPSVILLVNKICYWLAGSKNKTYVVKPSLLYKRNDSVMKTLVLYVKEKQLFRKTLSCPVFT